MFFIFKIYIFAIFNFLEKTSEIFWKFFQFYTRSFLHCKFFMNLMCSVMITVIRKFPINSNGRMERLMCNFHSPNLSIHQNSTQEPTWNFLVTLVILWKKWTFDYLNPRFTSLYHIKTPLIVRISISTVSLWVPKRVLLEDSLY